jgi:hypothetical protein
MIFLGDLIYISSYWVFYHSLAENRNPLYPVPAYIKNQLQLFGYYTISFFMIRYCMNMLEEIENYQKFI